MTGTGPRIIDDPFGIGVHSYNRMATVLANRPHMTRDEWFEQLGDAWECCDNIAFFRPVLRRILQAASHEDLGLMMTPDERKALSSLPARIEVWRGCYAVNRTGLSWSLDRSLAARFPTLHRYRRAGDKSILRRGLVRRDRVVLKLERDELEIVAPRVFEITESML